MLCLFEFHIHLACLRETVSPEVNRFRGEPFFFFIYIFFNVSTVSGKLSRERFERQPKYRHFPQIRRLIMEFIRRLHLTLCLYCHKKQISVRAALGFGGTSRSDARTKRNKKHHVQPVQIDFAADRQDLQRLRCSVTRVCALLFCRC